MSSKTAVVTGPISVGCCVNRTPSPLSRSYSACTSSTAKEVNGMPSATSASLNGLAAGCPSGSSSSSVPSGSLGRDHGQPAGLAQRDLGLLHEAEHLGVEASAFSWSSTSTLVMLILIGSPVVVGASHRSAMRSSGAVSRWWNLYRPSPAGLDQAGRLEHVEVLRDRLAGRGRAGAWWPGGRRSRTASARPLGQLVKDLLRVGSARALKRSPTWKRICKSLLACQAGVAAGGAGRFRDPPLSAVAAARLATVSSDRLRPDWGEWSRRRRAPG